MKVVIIGSSGQLGQALLNHEPEEYEVIPFSGREVGDITDPEFRQTVVDLEADYVINLAASHDVEAIETDIDKAKEAFAVNGFAVGEFAKELPEETKLVHISTDYVFNGNSNRSIPEVSQVRNPVNVYGATKLAGEVLIEVHRDNYLIVRTATLFGHEKPKGKDYNFVDLVVDRYRKGKMMKVVYNQYTSPSYTKYVAKDIWSKLDINERHHHSVCKGTCSLAELATAVVDRVFDDTSNIRPIDTKFGEAERPKHSDLVNIYHDNDMPHWKAALDEYLKEEGYIE